MVQKHYLRGPDVTVPTRALLTGVLSKHPQVSGLKVDLQLAFPLSLKHLKLPDEIVEYHVDPFLLASVLTSTGPFPPRGL